MEGIEIAYTLIFLSILGGYWALVRIFKKREKAYKITLESTQKRFDSQSSKLNILTRALPNLHALLSNSHSSDGWNALFLDEARALVKADGASYWSPRDQEQVMELESTRGSEVHVALGTKVPAESANMGEAVKKRICSLINN